VINNPKGAILGGNVSIAAGGTLSLTRGNIATGSHSLTLNNSAAGSLSLDTNKIHGTVTRAIAPGASSTYLFLSSDAFVIPSGTGNPSTISMTEYPGTNPPNIPPSADTTKIARRYYAFSFPGSGTGFTCTVRLPYLQSEVRGTENLYDIWSYGVSGWSNVGVSNIDMSANYIQQNGLSGVTTLAIAEGGAALPIQLASFNAAPVPQSEDVVLTWTTLSETNNFGFFVEQSAGTLEGFADAPNGFVEGHGTTLDRHNYVWTARDVPPGVYYFRLRQVDLDGTIHYTEAVRVEVKVATGVDNARMPAVFALRQNFPNPFNPSTRIQFTVEERAQTKLQVYNLLGQEVATLFTGEAQPGQLYAVSFDGSSLPNGAYFYRLTSGEKTSLKKMILLK
jgi:hypothetical protein